MQRELALVGQASWPVLAAFRCLLVAALAAAGAGAQSNPPAADIGVLKVQGNVYMLVGAGGNIAAQVGEDGILVVDTGAEALSPKVAAALRKLSDKPIRWVVNTAADLDHTGGNDAVARLTGVGEGGARPRIVAHEMVLNRMSATPKASQPAVSDELWPNDEYATPTKDFSFNGEAVVVYHVPAAHTDGDSMAHFRRSDVLATGDVFTPGRYPAIDLERGGSVQGLIDAVNQILRITVPLKYQEAGTYVIPGHGRLCDEADVVEFRDMVTIVRDRVRDMIAKG